MDKNDKNNLDNWQDIAKRLRNHEEPYKAGAWEKFEAEYLDRESVEAPTPVYSIHKTRSFRNTWKMWSSGVAAAALILFGLIWMWPENTPPVDLQQSPVLVQSEENPVILDQAPDLNSTFSQESKEESPQIFALTHETSSDTKEIISKEILPPAVTLAQQLSFAVYEAIQIDPSLSLHQPESDLANLVATSTKNNRSTSTITKEKNGLLSSIFGNLNEDLSVNNMVNGDRRLGDGKWALGLSVASMLTSSEEMNVGGGISVAYKLSDRLFLRSGISLAKLGVSTPSSGSRGPSSYVGYTSTTNSSGGAQGPAGPQGPSSPGSTTESFASVSPEAVPGYYTRLLSGASSNLLTVDVPLDLKYFVTNKFFASVGVSFLGILNENRTNHYIENINQPLFNGYTANGQDLQYATKMLHVNEATQYQPLKGNGYAGYLNFSIGRQTRISNKFNLSIEPFYKLPVGKLMREEMNMANGGIRIVTGF